MRKLLLNEEFLAERLSTDKFVLVDGGSRGELFKPFNRVRNDILICVRFDADKDAEIDIQDSSNIVICKALWNKSSSLTLNVAEEPSTSSLFTFHTKLQTCIDPLIDKRRIKREVEVESVSLDELVTDGVIPKVDFIKLDIHGAEYEALQGSGEILKSCKGILLESWTIPIHKGQKLRGKVESFINEKGFYLFEEFNRSRWSRMSSLSMKKQLVSLDSFYLKDPILNSDINNELDALKLVGIADLFNHKGFAKQLFIHFKEQEVLQKEVIEFLESFFSRNYRVTPADIIRNLIDSFYWKWINDSSFK